LAISDETDSPKGGDVDHRFHLFIRAGFADDNAPVGVTNQHHRPILLSDGALREGDIVGQRGRRVLDDRHIVALLLQRVVDTLPPGAIGEAAMDQNDIFDVGRSREGWRASGDGNRGVGHFSFSFCLLR
jgi:hypothetical protein